MFLIIKNLNPNNIFYKAKQNKLKIKKKKKTIELKKKFKFYTKKVKT